MCILQERGQVVGEDLIHARVYTHGYFAFRRAYIYILYSDGDIRELATVVFVQTAPKPPSS